MDIKLHEIMLKILLQRRLISRSFVIFNPLVPGVH